MTEVLESGQAAAHPFVVGELACGNLAARKRVLDLLKGMRQVAVATDDETLAFIENHALMGRGIGYVDAHLLAACGLNRTALWTRDKPLRAVARKLDLAYG